MQKCKILRINGEDLKNKNKMQLQYFFSCFIELRPLKK